MSVSLVHNMTLELALRQLSLVHNNYDAGAYVASVMNIRISIPGYFTF